MTKFAKSDAEGFKALFGFRGQLEDVAICWSQRDIVWSSSHVDMVVRSLNKVVNVGRVGGNVWVQQMTSPKSELWSSFSEFSRRVKVLLLKPVKDARWGQRHGFTVLNDSIRWIVYDTPCHFYVN